MSANKKRKSTRDSRRTYSPAHYSPSPHSHPPTTPVNLTQTVDDPLPQHFHPFKKTILPSFAVVSGTSSSGRPRVLYSGPTCRPHTLIDPAKRGVEEPNLAEPGCDDIGGRRKRVARVCGLIVPFLHLPQLFKSIGNELPCRGAHEFCLRLPVQERHLQRVPSRTRSFPS